MTVDTANSTMEASVVITADMNAQISETENTQPDQNSPRFTRQKAWTSMAVDTLRLSQVEAKLHPDNPSHTSIIALIQQMAAVPVLQLIATALFLILLMIGVCLGVILDQLAPTNRVLYLCVHFVYATSFAAFTMLAFQSAKHLTGFDHMIGHKGIRPHNELHPVVVDSLRYRRLEVLCRYGDYLADRQLVLKRHISNMKLKLPGGKELPDRWTEVSDRLQMEVSQVEKPYHVLIDTAANDLSWSRNTTHFLIHEYGRRNRLMHADLDILVKGKSWDELGKRCQSDINELHELYIDVNDESKVAIANWENVIADFRDRWLERKSPSGRFEVRKVIQKAIDEGIHDPKWLSKVADISINAQEDARTAQVDTLIERWKKQDAPSMEADETIKELRKQVLGLNEKISRLTTEMDPNDPRKVKEEQKDHSEGLLRALKSSREKIKLLEERIQELEIRRANST